MKHILLSTVAFFPIAATADTFATPMVPAQAVVYPQGAAVTSRAVLDVPEGVHEIVFLVPRQSIDRVAPGISVNGATLKGVNYSEAHYFDPNAYYTERQHGLVDQVEAAEDQVRAVQSALSKFDADIAAIDAQMEYLKSITPSTETPQSLDDLQAIASYIPTALAAAAQARADVIENKRTATRDLDEAQEELTRAKTLAQAEGMPDADWAQVMLRVEVEDDGPIAINMRSFAADAYWRPEYDIRLDEGANTIALTRKAQIHQNTGQAWHNVQMRLSSALPFQTLLPVLPIRDEVQLLQLYKGLGVAPSRMMEPMMEADAEISLSAPIPENLTGTFDGVAVEFDLADRVHLLSGRDNIEHIILDPLELTVDVDCYANARRDDYAFVRASFVNETGQPILPGDASYFWNGSLVGQDQLSLIGINASEKLFFGPDKTLPGTLQFLSKQSGDQGYFTRSNTRNETMRFAVENLGDSPRDVVVSYALPVSVEEDITVEIDTSLAPDRRNVDGEPGVAEWDFGLNAGQSRSVTLDFEITWPEDQQINWQP